MDEVQRKAANEPLRAERFGIQGAMIDAFAKTEVVVDEQTGRPKFRGGIPVRPDEHRGRYDSTSVRLDGSSGVDRYFVWKPNQLQATKFEDFQRDAERDLLDRRKSWSATEITKAGPVLAMAGRLIEVGQKQRDLNVVEAVLADEDDRQLTGDAAKTVEEVFGRLPMDNISAIYGEMADATLQQLDAMGVADVAERLRALDDIVLQTRDISQHHFGHFRSGESDDIETAAQLSMLGVTLEADNTGRYRLDWAERVKPKPVENMPSRTQHCAAAYRVEGQPSAIEQFGWAFNTELLQRGLLEPGVAQQPAPSNILPPKLDDKF